MIRTAVFTAFSIKHDFSHEPFPPSVHTQQALHRVRTNHAAKTIQSFWKNIRAKRAQEAKKKKKAEAKKKR